MVEKKKNIRSNGANKKHEILAFQYVPFFVQFVFSPPPPSFHSFHRFLFQSFNFFSSVIFSRLFVLHVEIETQECS